MVHVIFDTNSVGLDDFIQFGGGNAYFEGIPPYQRGRGAFRQRGAGVGSILRGLWRTLLPILKTVGSTVKKEGMATGGRILSNLAEGGNLQQTLLNEGKTGVTNIANQLKANQQGRGVIRRRKIALKPSLIKKRVGERSNSKLRSLKKSRINTFGLY